MQGGTDALLKFSFFLFIFCRYPLDGGEKR
nr:MAG TPA: hypothetical protein [Caudoviricetes sp.]